MIPNVSNTVNNVLESIALFPLEDQIMIAEIVQKRIIEEKRNILSQTIKERREEYSAGTTKSGSVDDFIKDLDTKE